MTTASSYLACHHSYRQYGTLSIIEISHSDFTIHPYPSAAAQPLSEEKSPIYLYFNAGNAYCFDPIKKEVTAHAALVKNAMAGYAYMDPLRANIWFMNDGDKDTGLDRLNCGSQGSSVTIIHEENSSAAFLKTVCVGRGHHVTAFVNTAESSSSGSHKAFVSNLLDGSLSVIDNDPDSQHFLQLIDVINLGDSHYEKGNKAGIPNQAFPHGMVFSNVTGKLYSLNNGYGTVAVIDPLSHKITAVISMKQCSNLLLSPDGRYLIGKGADRKSNPNHVIGQLKVVDLENLNVVIEMELPDIYPSTYQFNTEGEKLYITTAQTGNKQQAKHLQTNQLLVFTADFPKLQLEKSITVGHALCKRRPICFCQENNRTRFIFVPNLTDGSISILDGQTQHLLQTPSVAAPNAEEITFSYWRSCFFGN